MRVYFHDRAVHRSIGARCYNPALGRSLTPEWSATPEAVPYANRREQAARAGARANFFDASQRLTSTMGCTRARNADVIGLGNATARFQQANPEIPIPYMRVWQ